MKDHIIKEAESMGLTILKSANSGKSYEYRFKSCGHHQIMQHGNLLRKGFAECYTCKENSLSEYALRNGMTLLKDTTDCTLGQRLFKYNRCGHVLKTQPSAIKSRVPKCSQCIKEKHEAIANSFGLTILEDSVVGKRGYKLYKKLDCGHTFESTPNCIRDSDIHCKQCYYEQLHKEAIAADVTLLGDCPSGNKARRLYRINKCGHEKSIQTYQVRHKIIICDTCEEYYWGLPSTLYVIKIISDGFSWLKIGFSNKVDFRIKRYGLTNNSEVELLFSHKFNSGKVASFYESILHEKLGSFRLNKSFMQQYHSRSGFTECFYCEEHTTVAIAKEVCNLELNII